MDCSQIKHGWTGLVFLAAATGLLSGCRPVAAPGATAADPEEIRSAMAESTAPLTLVHVWATWCEPCREEFPELLRVYRDTRDAGLSLLLVSADDPAETDAVEAFLKEQQSPVGSLITTELNQDFIELFSPDWAGALPASFFFDPNGNLLAEWQGKRSYEEYVETIDQLLNP
jgi:thiol-disulfide isomerase/thioredoxin